MNLALKFMIKKKKSHSISAQKSPDLVVFYPLVIAAPIASFSKLALQIKKISLQQHIGLCMLWEWKCKMLQVCYSIQITSDLWGIWKERKNSNQGSFFGGNARKIFFFNSS